MSKQPKPILVLRVALQVEAFFHNISARFKKPLDAGQPLHVIAYYGFGNSTHAQLSGRVLLRNQRTLRATARRCDNYRNNYAHFNTDELAGITINGRSGDCQSSTVSDDEGYFTLTFDTADIALSQQHRVAAKHCIATIPVKLTLPGHPNVHMDGEPAIMMPTDNARFGVISDVDDTLIITNATSLFRMLKLTLLGTVESREVCPGIAKFYAALHDQANPFFYVSSSPWNLYSFLNDFMRHHGIVHGPIMLRDFGLDETKFIAGSHTDHKLVQIRRILDCYPILSFILSGDSGQDDPQIYAQIAQEYPGRIKAIYIRDVGSEASRINVRVLAEQLAQQQIDLLLITNTLEAATHAAEQGFISDEALQDLSIIENIHSCAV